MLAFESPLALLFLCIIPLYYVLVYVKILRKPAIPITLFDWNSTVLPKISPVIPFLLIVSKIFLFFGLCLTICALASPVQYTQESIFSREGASVIFVLDASPSMAAQDIGQKTRFIAAKEWITSFLNRRTQDSFGLVALGSDAALLIPPTTDHSALIERLSLLSIGEFGDGTALGMALSVAAAHLVDAVNSSKTIVLLTDGENNAGEISPLVAADMLKHHDISLHVIGIGTRGDVSVEYTDMQTGKTYSGILASDFNESSLRALSERAGGSYSPAASSEALDSVSSFIDSSVPILISSYQKPVAHSLSYIFIYAAMIAFFCFWFITRIILRSFL